MKKESIVDIAKLFFAYIVVAIHTNAFSEIMIGEVNVGILVSRLLYDFAVPFFFVCSGFFLGNKLIKVDKKCEKKIIIIKYFKRLLVPYLVWGIWYFIINCSLEIVTEEKSILDVVKTHLKQWVMTSPGGGLWYVQSILILLGFLYCFGINKSFNIIWFILLILSTISEFGYSIMNKYEYIKRIIDLYEMIFVSRLNFVFFGIFFFQGIFLVKYFNFFEKILKKRLFFYTIITYIMYCISIYASGIGYIFMNLFKILFISMLFLILYNTELPLKKIDTLKIRKMSNIIYFTHFTYIYVFKVVMTLLRISFDKYATIMFILCGILLTIYSMIIIKKNKKRKIIDLIY